MHIYFSIKIDRLVVCEEIILSCCSCCWSRYVGHATECGFYAIPDHATNSLAVASSCCAIQRTLSVIATTVSCHCSASTMTLEICRLAHSSWKPATELLFYYRAMHFSAKRGIAIACRLSVCQSIRPSVTLVNCDHIGWYSSKIICPLVSLGRSLFATPTWRVCSKGNTPKFSPE